MRRALVLSLLVVLLSAPMAEASYDPVSGGATRLALDKRFVAFLGKAGVSVGATAGATQRNGKLAFPVSGGQLDPTTAKGEIDHLGTIVFQSQRSRVLIRKLVFKTTPAPLVAKVGGSQLKLATSDTPASNRDGFATDFTARQLKLTDKVATRLNKKLRPRRDFQEGQVIGALATEARPLLTAILPSGRATLVFDSAFVAKLDSHFVSINPIFPAEHIGPTFTLPVIPGGVLAPDASQGTLRTGGEVEFLRLGAGQVFWHELWFDLSLRAALAEVDLEPTPAFPGKLGQISVLALGNSATSSDAPTRTIRIDGAPLTLSADTAAAFNRAFADGQDEFTAGETVATLSFAAEAQ